MPKNNSNKLCAPYFTPPYVMPEFSKKKKTNKKLTTVKQTFFKRATLKPVQRTSHIFDFLKKADSAEKRNDVKEFHLFCDKAEIAFLDLKPPTLYEEKCKQYKLHRIISRNICRKELHPVETNTNNFKKQK